MNSKISNIEIQNDKISGITGSIASLACTLQEICGVAAEEAQEDPVLVATLMHSADALAQQIGYLADLATKALGGTQFKGGAEAWMVPFAAEECTATTANS